MFIVFVLILAVVLGLLSTKGNERKALIGAIFAILYFPLGVILALTKKYK